MPQSRYRFYGIGLTPTDVRYIGATTQTRAARFAQHQSAARRGSTRMPIHAWLRKHPEAQVFDLGSGSFSQEVHLIAAYRAAGHRLLNLAPGGPFIPAAKKPGRRRRKRGR